MDLSQLILTVDEARSIDQAAVKELGISSLLLMENAARGIADLITRSFGKMNHIVIACGFGNNGGDGLALARLLAAKATVPEIYLVHAERPLSDDASSNLNYLRQAGVAVVEDPCGTQVCQRIKQLTADSLIVDCLLGTGIQGPLRSPFDRVVNSINESIAPVLAVDVPSGLDSDCGVAGMPTVKATRTITFAGLKTGFQNSASAPFVGQVEVAHIGLPLSWTQELLKRIRAENDRGPR